MIAVGDWSADNDVLVAGMDVQEHVEGGQQRHEQRGAFVGSEVP